MFAVEEMSKSFTDLRANWMAERYLLLLMLRMSREVGAIPARVVRVVSETMRVSMSETPAAKLILSSLLRVMRLRVLTEVKEGKLAEERDWRISRERVSEMFASFGAAMEERVVTLFTLREPWIDWTPLMAAESIGFVRMMSPLKVEHFEMESKSDWEEAVRDFEQMSLLLSAETAETRRGKRKALKSIVNDFFLLKKQSRNEEKGSVGGVFFFFLL